MKSESIPYIREMLRSLRGLKHNLERFNKSAEDLAKSEEEQKLIQASSILKVSFYPASQAIGNLEGLLEKWLEDHN